MARQAPKYPPELDHMIASEARKGTGPRAIWRMIRDGRLDGLDEPINMPEPTFWDRWRRIRDTILEPAPEIKEGEEREKVDWLGRELIALTCGEVKRLKAKQGQEGLDEKDGLLLQRLSKTFGDLRRILDGPQVKPATKPSARSGELRAAGGHKPSEDATRRRLREMAERLKQEEERGEGEARFEGEEAQGA